MRNLVAAFATLTLLGGARAQDKSEDGKALVSEALRVTFEKGGVVLKGKLELESPMGADVSGMQGIEGEFTVRIGANGVGTLKMEQEIGSLEVFWKGDKRAQRLMWGDNAQPMVDGFVRMVTRLVRLDTLGRHAKEAKGLKKVADKKVGDIECMVVNGALPGELGDDDAEQFPTLVADKAEGRFFLSKKDGRLLRMDISVTKKFSEHVMKEGKKAKDGDKDEGEKEGQQEGQREVLSSMRFEYNYSFTVETDPGLRVEVPKELQKLIQD